MDLIIEKMIDYIRNMDDGESSSIRTIYNIVSNQECSVDQLFDIQETIVKRCEELGIICDYSKYDGAIVGLPFDIDFVKRGINETKKLEEDVIYEKRKLDEYLDKRQKETEEHQNKLENIKKLFFENNSELFDKIKMYLYETFDYDILTNPIDNCIRFEIYDKTNKKRMFFAINKDMFLLNDFSKHKLNLRGNTEEERISKLTSKIKKIIETWDSSYENSGDYYWGLTICEDNKSLLYVGKSYFPNNWNELTTEINNNIEELMANIIKETLI